MNDTLLSTLGAAMQQCPDRLAKFFDNLFTKVSDMNNGVAVVSSTTPPAIPQAMLDQYNALAVAMSSGFGASMNFIRPGKMNFKLIENGVAREVANNDVAGVLLGIAPHDYCTWYEKAYTPGQEPEQPDLMWIWPNQNVFPDALPAQFRKKQMINGKERWGFRVARRSVWALAFRDATGQIQLNLELPYILDITSMSMFGKSDPQINTYKFSGLMGLCQRLSQPPHFICSPSMFLTQILIDAASPVSGVVVFRPAMSNGTPQYLDNGTFQQVLQLMMSQQVQDMLKIREKLTRETTSVTEQYMQSTPSPRMAQSDPAVHVGGPNMQQPVPDVSPVAQQPTVSVQTMPSEDLLAQAQAVLNGQQPPVVPQQPAPSLGGGIPINPGINPVTAQAVNALDGFLS